MLSTFVLSRLSRYVYRSSNFKTFTPCQIAPCSVLKYYSTNTEAEASETATGDKEIAQNQMPKKKGLIRPTHSVETSIKYVNSKVFAEAYGGLPPWKLYRRNLRGRDYERKVRPSCLSKENEYITNNPCPVCRDEYFVLDYRNPKLLQQFMWEEVMEPVGWKDSMICKQQYVKLRAEIVRSRMYGYMPFKVPYRVYDFRDYYSWWKEEPAEVDDEPSPYKLERDESHTIFPEHNREINKFEDPWWLRWDAFAKKMK